MGKFVRWVLWSAVTALGGWVVLKLLRTTAQNDATPLPSARAVVKDVREEIANVTSSPQLAPTPSKKSFGKVNLNKASQDELAALHGVGFVLAERIVAARPFDAVTDLTRVSGIGKAKLEELKGFVTL